MLLRQIYIIFIGVLFATFVGVGIAAFYSQPKHPEYPTSIKFSPEKPGEPDAESLRLQEEFDKQSRDYQVTIKQYNRNVSIISLVIAVIAVAFSLTIIKQWTLFADGLLLGGVFTLIYSIIRGFATDIDTFRFFVVTVSLITSLVIGYVKFLKPSNSRS